MHTHTRVASKVHRKFLLLIDFSKIRDPPNPLALLSQAAGTGELDSLCRKASMEKGVRTALAFVKGNRVT